MLLKKIIQALSVVIVFSIFFGIIPTTLAVTKRNMIYNGEFDKKTEEWGITLNKDSNGSIKVIRDAGLSGRNSLKVALNNPGSVYYDVAVNQNFPIKSGRNYSIEFMAKSDKNRTATLILQMLDAPYTVHFRQEINITTEAKTFGPFSFNSIIDDASCSFRICLGTDATTTYLDKIQIYDVSRLDQSDKTSLQYNPETLEKFNGVHPRLFIDKAKVSKLKEEIKRGGMYSHIWEKIKRQADGVIKGKPAEYVYSSDINWQRVVGNDMTLLSAAYLFSGEEKYLQAAKAWALKACTYETFGTREENNLHLAAGHLFVGLGVVYDWCYDSLTIQERKTIRKAIIEHGTATYQGTSSIWWRETYLQNHNWIGVSGLAVAALSIYDEEPKVLPWINKTLEMMKTSFSVMGQDGASVEESMTYAEYGLQFLLQFTDLSKNLLGVNFFESEWMKQHINYFTYLSLPQTSWSAKSRIMDIGDAPRRDWYGPEQSLRKLAQEYKDGHAQWLASEIDKANLEDPAARFLNMAWYDPDVQETPPTDLPTLHHFTNMDIVSARSDWSGKESMVLFKSGPPGGHNMIQNAASDYGAGHAHPDAGNFILFANGETLIRDEGYAYKFTGQHNTLLINGKGQVGEGNMWLNVADVLKARSNPSITKVEENQELDYMVGDVTDAYPKDMGLKKFVRHLLFVKPDVLLVVDDIETNAPEQLELRFFPESQTVIRQADNGFYIPGQNSNFRLLPLTTDNVEIKSENVLVQNMSDSGQPKDKIAIKLLSKQQKWRNAVAMSWSSGDVIPTQVGLKQDGDIWSFDLANRTVTMDLSNNTAHINKPSNEVLLQVDGKMLNFDVPPIIENDTTLVPLRGIFEALGADVKWDEKSKTVTATKENDSIELTIGSSNAFVNNTLQKLDVPAKIQNDRVFVPVRFVSESLRAVVRWNENAHMVKIFSEKFSEQHSDAALIGVSINGDGVRNFSPGNYSYNIARTWSEDKNLSVAVMPSDLDASIIIEKGNKKKIMIDVTSLNGKVKNTYSFEILPLMGVGDIEISSVTASDEKAQPAIHVLDNDASTIWSSEGDGQWVKFDLGETKKVSGAMIAFYLGNKRQAIFDIQVSNDGDTWKTVYSGKSSGNTIDTEFFDFDDVEIRYLRYLAHGNSLNMFNSIIEMGIK